MRLSRWVQQAIAPILYGTVIILNESQARSILLAILYDSRRPEYKVTKLIKSLVLWDDFNPEYGHYAALASEIILALQQSTWEHLMIPLHLLAIMQVGMCKLPTSVTYTGDGALFTRYSYENVVRLRVTNHDATAHLWAFRGLLAIAKKITHLAIRICSNPWAGMSLVHQLAASRKMECFVVAVDLDPKEEFASNLLNLKNVTMGHLPATDLSKTVIWQWNDEINDLYHSEDADIFWEKAKSALG